jgi:hypothetical protein
VLGYFAYQKWGFSFLEEAGSPVKKEYQNIPDYFPPETGREFIPFASTIDRYRTYQPPDTLLPKDRETTGEVYHQTKSVLTGDRHVA